MAKICGLVRRIARRASGLWKHHPGRESQSAGTVRIDPSSEPGRLRSPPLMTLGKPQRSAYTQQFKRSLREETLSQRLWAPLRNKHGPDLTPRTACARRLRSFPGELGLTLFIKRGYALAEIRP